MNSTAERIAREVLADRYPEALAAVLAGSSAIGGDTTTSDVDLMLLLPGHAAHRDTLRRRERVVEVFAHTEESFRTFVERETAARRSPTLHMWATGRLLLDRDGVGTELQVEASARFAAGPPPLAKRETDNIRYRITDLLDDLAGTPTPGEAVFVAARLLTETAELALAHHGRWLGTGKWLWRRLRSAEPALAQELVVAFQDVANQGPDRLLAAVHTVLSRVGGPLREGYRR
ncbi:nucleotidyltransferase domain-containing protein [Actinokineospora auranticolor]|uniref:Nucleotidyltransferase-like protein n=1 Tax=Actinokineospora auranticolor TaxID=155976 RepID=A0A2S6GNQ9_9PSEU|nr:nucleotidyltransferase domain-containing protein [Actinokineospora auranticolor]PPK66875.1 hypothetical protein CLV40_109260 [Actinokineospora auranticolor]